MEIVFYLSAFVAVFTTFMVITNDSAVHALLYLVVSLLSAAMIFVTLGAPFAALLEVIVYAGAILVLFVFVVMMLNLGDRSAALEREWLRPKAWIGPGLLSALMFALLCHALSTETLHPAGLHEIDAKQVGIWLYGPYLLVVEFGSMLLLAALVVAYHLGKHE